MTETRIHLSGPENMPRPDAAVDAAVQLQAMFPRSSYALRYSGEGELTYEDGQTILRFEYDVETGDVTVPDLDDAIERVEERMDKATDAERELEEQIQALQRKLADAERDSKSVRNVLRSLYMLEATGDAA